VQWGWGWLWASRGYRNTLPLALSDVAARRVCQTLSTSFVGVQYSTWSSGALPTFYSTYTPADDGYTVICKDIDIYHFAPDEIRHILSDPGKLEGKLNACYLVLYAGTVQGWCKGVLLYLSLVV